MEEKNKLTTLSNIMYYVAKIAEIFTYIVGVSLFLAFTFIVTNYNKIEITNEKVTYKDKEYTYKIEDEGIIISGIEEEDTILTYEDMDTTKEAVITVQEKILEELENHDVNYYIVCISIIIVLAIVSIVILNRLLVNCEKLFKNLSQEVPFTDKNIELLNTIGIYLIILAVYSVFMSSLSSIMINYSMTINLTEIIPILLVYMVKYIFEYGKSLENNKHEETK